MSKLILIALSFLSIILLIRLFTFNSNIHPYPEGTVVSFTTQIQDQPQVSSRGQKVSLNLPNYQRISVTFSLLPTLNYGDKVKVEGRVQYFVAEDGKKIAFMTYPKFVIVDAQSQTNLIYKVRLNIISFFNSHLSDTDASLMLGIVFGIKEQMSPGFYANLQKTGLLHVIAASGMNITMAAGFFLSIFTLLVRRQVALFLSIIGILLYTLLAGFEPSIVRAAIMGILVFSSQILGRQGSAWLGLFFAGFVMLFINPTLLFDIGFQLSFMATLGLIYLSPVFYVSKRLGLLIEKSVIGGDLVTTISAQIITLPILLTNFGTYSPVSILVNGLVLWTVPIIMLFGGLSALLGLVFEPLGALLSYLAIPFLRLFEAVVNFFGSNISLIKVDNLPLAFGLGYYLLLLSLTLFLRRR